MPTCFSELVFADPLVQKRLALYAERMAYNNIILYGPYGTAKTTTAELIVRERHKHVGLSAGYIERIPLDQLSRNIERLENGIAVQQCVNSADSQPYGLIDEIDQLKQSDQLRLRTALDSLGVGKVILTTNHLGKIDGGLKSRCDVIHLSQLSAGVLLSRAQAILAAENVTVDVHQLSRLLQTVSDLRDMMRVLEMLVLEARAGANGPHPPPKPSLRVVPPLPSV
jgi:replication-associated recombination protein RarA